MNTESNNNVVENVSEGVEMNEQTLAEQVAALTAQIAMLTNNILEAEMTTEEKIAALITKMAKPLEAGEGAKMAMELVTLLAEKTGRSNIGMAKNHIPGKPNADRMYVLLTKTLESWGKIPQQQADLAKILVANMEVGKEYSEKFVFDLVTEKGQDFQSIRGSKQDATYLFRYYRGLKAEGKHAGFIRRNFLKVIG